MSPKDLPRLQRAQQVPLMCLEVWSMTSQWMKLAMPGLKPITQYMVDNPSSSWKMDWFLLIIPEDKP